MNNKFLSLYIKVKERPKPLQSPLNGPTKLDAALIPSANECSNNFTYEYDLNTTIAGLSRDPQEKPVYESGPCWEPEGCDRTQNILVVIPYRDRERSLRFSLPILHHILQKQQKKYCILLVEQVIH